MSEFKNAAALREGPTRRPVREDYEARYWPEKLEGPSPPSKKESKTRGPGSRVVRSTPRSTS